MKINNKEIFCLIPARGGSKRIKNKNITLLKKKPLVWHTINFAKKIKNSHIVLSTDSEKIYKICSKFIKIDGLRPKKLADDLTTTFKVAKYELLKIEKKNNFKFKYILLLQPTVPFRKFSDFQKTFRYISNKNIDSVTTITDVGSFHPDRMKIIKKNKIFNYNNLKKENMKPFQLLKKVYIRSGSIYLIKRSAFFKYKSFVGANCRGVIVKDKFAINIDTYNDLELAKFF